MKSKLLWRFRKGSEANPIQTLPCGCKIYVYDKTIVWYCDEHNPNLKFDEVDRVALDQLKGSL